MASVMRYKDFVAKVQYSEEDDVFFGVVLSISGSVSFEGRSVKELKKDFRDAIDLYLETCKENSIPVFKQYKGSFNIRVSPDTHRRASETAAARGISLNQFVGESIERELAEG
ncbi:MAG: type II toxin-antitoxin system HicB family antitoxin [Thermodesulfobacteriota bacterium]